MSLSQDLATIALQEERLQFERFDANTAWEIGSRLKAAAEAQGLSVAIDIALHGGATLPGRYQGRDITVLDTYETLGAVIAGTASEAEVAAT